jgi:hypothetical protein
MQRYRKAVKTGGDSKPVFSTLLELEQTFVMEEAIALRSSETWEAIALPERVLLALFAQHATIDSAITVRLMQTTTLYDQDFYAWTQQQAELLRSGRVEGLDIENLAEEIESLGRQERQELRNRLGVLMGHLLKWRYQPEARSKSWTGTIREQRYRIDRLLKENPSLKPYLAEAIALAYPLALALVEQETPLDPNTLPQICPFSEAQIFDEPVELEA